MYDRKKVLKILALLFVIWLFLPYNILILGSDARDNIKGSRSDGIILVKVVPLLFKVKVLSVPRDTYTYIPCKKKYDKINHAFAYGSTKCSITTVSKLLSTKINYHVVFKFKDITNITNMIGGVDIVANNTFTQNNFSFEKGKIYNLKGEMALAYVRHRKTDGAFKRDERQRQVLKQIVKKILLNPILGYKVYKSLDIRYNPIKAIPSMLVLLNHNFITQYTINGKGEKKNGVYYFMPDKKSLNSIKWKFKI